MSSMEPLNREDTKSRLPHLFFLFGLALATLITASCGPDVIKGRPPFVGISSMELDGQSVATRFDISNGNGVEMNIRSISISVSVRNNPLLEHRANELLVIDANSTEEIAVRLPVDEFAQTLLKSLSEGELDNLPIGISGRVDTVEDGPLRFEQEGYVYRVPGRPGQFRAAVTQAKGLVREDRL